MILDIHPFEKSGLGVAPFRFVGVSEKVYCACPGAPEQPGATVAREEARIEKALVAYPTVRDAMATQPHPQSGPWFADKTLADWVEWMVRNAGHSGRLQVARAIEKYTG